MSPEWYTRLEKGRIGGVSEDVLDAVARALRLSEDDRTYLFDLARAAQPGPAARRRRKAVDIPPRVQWILDSMTRRRPAQTPRQLGGHPRRGPGEPPRHP